jgi:hypothetical protein
MSEGSVVVAKFSVPLEAEMAKGLLESEGIAAQVSGDLSSAVYNVGAAGALVQLLVSAADADRAAAVLNDHKERLRHGDEWLEEAEEDVWVCSVCGTAVDKDLLECTACQTPKEAVLTGPGSRLHLRRATPDEDERKSDQIAPEPKPPVSDFPEPEKDIEAPNLPMLYASDLAWRAFLGAVAPLLIFPFMCVNPVFLIVILPFLGYSAWCLVRLGFFSSGELGKASWVFLLGALAVHSLYIILVSLFVRTLFNSP